MAPSPLQQRRTHNTLLFQKLLNLRDGASPFTLILDTLEQGGSPVIREFARRAQLSKTTIVYISYKTLRRRVSFDLDIFISARSKSLSDLRKEIVSNLPTPGPTTTSGSATKYLIIIDTLTPLAASHPQHLSTFLSSLLISPQISLLATYHTDVPLPSSSPTFYNPSPLTTLLYLSTAILTISSLHHTLAAKRARDKSLHPPAFGLSESKEGLLVSLKTGSKIGEEGVVVQMELRRKSGRGVVDTFVLSPSYFSSSTASSSKSPPPQIILLDEHPSYAPPVLAAVLTDKGRGAEDEEEGTFSLQLTEKQKRDRDGVVLPYFDAQSEGGVGEGGRILYEMGEEDREDFDDEEDEI